MVVSIDYTKMEAIRDAGGKEERQKLSPGTDGFATCTWADGATHISDVPNLLLKAKAAPAKKKPAAAKSKAKAKAAPLPAGSDFEDEPDDVDADGEGPADGVDADGDEAEVGEPAAKKPKKEDSSPLNPLHIHIYADM